MNDVCFVTFEPNWKLIAAPFSLTHDSPEALVNLSVQSKAGLIINLVPSHCFPVVN